MHDTWRIKRNSGCHIEIILIYKNIYKKKKKSLNVSMSDGTNPFLLEGGGGGGGGRGAIYRAVNYH